VKATEVTAGPAESNGSLLLGIWRDSLHVTCGLTACTPPGPTLGNEYGKTLPFSYLFKVTIDWYLPTFSTAYTERDSSSIRLSVLPPVLRTDHWCCKSTGKSVGALRSPQSMEERYGRPFSIHSQLPEVPVCLWEVNNYCCLTSIISSVIRHFVKKSAVVFITETEIISVAWVSVNCKLYLHRWHLAVLVTFEACLLQEWVMMFHVQDFISLYPTAYSFPTICIQ